MFTGPSPATMTLPASVGYFQKAEYIITVYAPGREPYQQRLNYRLDGWYFGNIIFGGLIGQLVVDPLTGAMFKPEEEFIFIDLGTDDGGLGSAAGPALRVIELGAVPAEQRQHLTELCP